MRLFLVAVGLLALMGCERATAGVGAVRVDIYYATFRPGCLSVTAVDVEDAGRTETQRLKVDEARSGTRTVAVFRKPDWSRNLRVTASAREGSCEGPEVATSSQQLEIPQRGTTVASLDLRAEDRDGDRFIPLSGGGTDCDDTDGTVYPGAVETCDGKDSNCSAGEEDATGKQTYFVDADGDGYGTTAVTACARPGLVSRGGDCLDTDPSVRPGQEELRCDDRDDNCDRQVDEGFEVGAACVTERQCAGVRACTSDGVASQCNGTEVPVQRFEDRDGDGRTGTALSQLTCAIPAGSTLTPTDCDMDESRFMGGAEVCDRLDNDCDESVDEDGVCAASTWSARTVSTPTWSAVTTHARGKAWLAGAGGELVYVEGSTQTFRSGPCGGGTRNWTAAWARPSDGRVFLGSSERRLGSVHPTASDCTLGDPGSEVTGQVTGIVGFEQGAVTTLYAVTSSGHVLRWVWQDAPATLLPPKVMTQLPANLRGVHGLNPGTLLAVGGESYPVSGTTLPRAFSFDTASSTWGVETLPPEAGTGLLNAVNVVEEGLAYAVGDGGLVLERTATTWRTLPPPRGIPTPDLLDVVAFHPTVVLALPRTTISPAILLFDGTSWSTAYTPAQPLLSLDALGPEEQWASGNFGAAVRWGP